MEVHGPLALNVLAREKVREPAVPPLPGVEPGEVAPVVGIARLDHDRLQIDCLDIQNDGEGLALASAQIELVLLSLAPLVRDPDLLGPGGKTGERCWYYFPGTQVPSSDAESFGRQPYPVDAIMCGDHVVWISRDMVQQQVRLSVRGVDVHPAPPRHQPGNRVHTGAASPDGQD